MYLKKQIPAVILLSIISIFCFNIEAVQVTWTGTSSSDWNTANNWSPAAVPTVIDTVLFNSGINNCVVTGTVQMAMLKIEAGYDGTLTIDGATFSISGDASLSGAPADSLYLAAGTTAYLNATGNIYSNYAVLGNINSTGGSPGKAFYSRDAGGNANWTFMPEGLKIWDGGGVDNNWNTIENWLPDGIPTTTDSVVFDITSNKNCIVDAASSVKDLIIESSFTGTFALGSNTISIANDCKMANYSSGFSSGIGGFSFSGSISQTFEPMTSVDNPNIIVTNTSNLIINSTANISIKTLTIGSGSSITAPSSFELIVRNNFTNNGTFNHNGGIVVMDSTGGTHTIQSGGSQFNILRINGASAIYTLVDNIIADTIDVANGTLELGTGLTHSVQNINSTAGGSLNFGTSTLQVSNQAGLNNLTSLNIGDGTLEFNGGGAQSYYPGSFENPHVLITSIGPIQVISSNDAYIRSLTINSGSAFTAPTNWALVIRNSLINNGTFNHNNGVVKFDTTGGIHSINMGTSSFYKLTFTGIATYQLISNITIEDTLMLSGVTIDMGSGFTHSINHISTLASTATLNMNNSTIDLMGNADFSNLMSLQWQDNAVLHCMGTAAQTITPYGTIDHPPLSISNTTDVSFSGLSNDVTIRDLNINSGGVFTAPSSWKLKLRSSFINNGTFIHNNGTVEFDSISGNHDINSASMFNNLSINGLGANYQFTSNIQASKLTIQNGALSFNSSFVHTIDSIVSVAGSSTLDFNNSRTVINGNVDLTNISTIIASNDTIELNGIGSQNISAPASTIIGHVLKSGTGTLSLSNNLDVLSYTQTDGTLSLVSFDLNVQSSGDLTINKGSITGLDARQILVTGNANIVGAPADSIFIIPAAVGNLNVTGSLNANYAVIGNVNANGSQGVAINSRDAGGNTNWAFPPATTVDLYFSVGTNTTNLLTSSSFSTNGDTAIFGTPQSDNIGIGDKINYDGGLTAYIKERLSSTQYIIRKANGSFPDSSTVQVDGIYRAFNSLNNAVDSLNMATLLGTTNLKAINARLHFACYADSIDTSAVNITGFETDAQNGISIFTPGPIEQVGIPQNHHGMWTSDGYQLSVSGTGVSGRIFWIQVPYVKIQGLQIEYTGSNANTIQTIAVEADSCVISNNIIKLSEVSPPNQRMGIYIGGAYYTKISNNLIFDFINGSSSDAGIYTVSGAINLNMPIYNNTVFNCSNGISSASVNSVLSKNNLVYACSTNYVGTFSSGSSNNLSGPTQSNAPGSSALQATSVNFFDQGNGNFRLMYGTAAIDMGVSLTSDPALALDDDITFKNRDASFDIGAYEYINTIPNNPTLDTMIAGEVIQTNTEPLNVNLQFDISDPDSFSYVKYQIQVDDSANFGSPEIDSISTTLNNSPHNNIMHTVSLNSGSYYWRVKAIDQYEAPSAWTVANAGTIAFTVDGPDAPTNISLSISSINENHPANTEVALLTTSDPDAGNTFNYSFYAGPGDSNNSSFTIIGDTLKTTEVFNFETKNSYSILLNSTDNTSLSIQKQFTITVTNINEAPVDISLSDSTIDENMPDSSIVGILSSVDEDNSDIHTYMFIAGVGDSNNSDFIIVGDTLKALPSFDYETKNSYTIRLKSTDANGLTFEEPFTISVNDITEDITTQMPTLTKPTDNDTIHNFPYIDFTLPESALSQTVKMTFMQTGGVADSYSPHEIIFNSGFESVGQHTTTLNMMDLANNTNIDTVSSDPNDHLTHGSIYNVKLEYQDATSNPVSMVIAGNVLFTDTVVGPSAPFITTANYYESNNELHLTFDKPIFFVDTTKNFYLSTDNGISDTMIVQAPWTWNYFDTTKTTIKINVPTADISLLEGLPNITLLELSLQDSTFGDSLAWNGPIDYNMNIYVGYIENIGILHFSSATYNGITNELILTFNDTLTSIDTMAQLGIYHKNDTSLAFTFSTPWNYGLNNLKDTVKILISDADAGYIESWSGADTSLSLISSQNAFQSNNKYSSIHDKNSIYTVNYLKDPYLFNMFNFSLNNIGDTAIEAYLYFINTSHDTGSGVIVSYGFDYTPLDITLTPWAFKDSSFLISNTTQQGYWYFTWAPISLDGTIGEVFTDSIEIKNIAPQILADSIYSILEDSLWRIEKFVIDNNNDSIYISLIDAPEDMIINQTDQSISWIPDNDDVGLEEFSIIAIDSKGDSTKQVITITINNTNDMPAFDTVAIADTIYEDSIITGYIKAYDIDNGDSLKLFVEPDSSWIEVAFKEKDSTGNFRFQITLSPDNNFTGLKVIKYHIQDKSGAALAYFDTVFVVNTNDAPVVKMDRKLINHGAVSLAYSAEDDFDTTFTFILNLTSKNMFMNDTNSSGLFSYYPLEDGSYKIVCIAIDKGNLSDITIDSFTISGASKKNIAQTTNWNMITIPINTYNATPFKNGGTILHWDETKEANNIYKYYTRESGISSLKAGESYFIKNSDSTITISLTGDSLVKDSFNITLISGEYGWNQIGSPYAYPVKINNSEFTFWEYDHIAKDYVDAQGILIPWKGYWVQTDETANLTLNPSPIFEGTRARRSISRHNGEEDWIYTISLLTAISQDKDNFFGFIPEADNGKDRFDRPEAPRMNDVPYLFFKQNEWKSSINKFASDVRKKRASEDFFSIGISGSSENNENMTIKISGYQKNEDVYLFTRTTAGIAPYNPGTELTIEASDKDQYITVISSWKPELSIPLTFKTFSPYPNPCRPLANIRYTLPYSWEADGSMITGFNVKVVVYDVKGRIIKELLNSRQKPGTHKVVWNGKNSGGSMAASGAYFVKVDAGKHRAVKKIMLMR